MRRGTRRARRSGARAPSSRPAARRVARAEHEVGAVRGRDQPRHVGRVVREVAVHLEHELGAVRERAPEARDVGRADPLLRLAVEDRDPRELRESRSAISPVPSGEPSSMTRTRSASCRARRRARRSSPRGSRARCTSGGRGPREASPYHRGMPQTLPRNGELADQLDLLADLSEILDEESFKVIAYRRAAGRIRESPLPIAELALDGKAKELPGIGKTIEKKVVEVVEDGEMHALTKRRGLVPAGSSTSCGFPASVRRRRRGSGRSSASPRSTASRALRRRAGCAISPAWARAARRRSSGRSRRVSATRRRNDGSSDRRSPRCDVSSPSSRRIRPRSPCPRLEACAGGARPCAIST